MGLMNIENLEAGMILAADVHDRSGRLLLGEGAELNMRHIRMFMTWGIQEVDIAGVDAPADQAPACENMDAFSMQSAEDELKPLFRNVNLQHPAMSELFRLCVIRKVRNEAS